MTNVQTEIEFLAGIIMKAKDCYYGSGSNLILDTPDAQRLKKSQGIDTRPSLEITDRVFDAIEDCLKNLDEGNKALKQIGAEMKYSTDKVDLPYPMPSLDKIKPDTGAVEEWSEANPGPYLEMHKADGVGVQIIWQDGKLRAYKAYDNLLGIEITHLLKHVNFGDIKLKDICPEDFKAIRCEFEMKESVFQEKWSVEALGELKGYKNARNLVSGIVNKTKGIHEAASDVDVLVLAVLEPLGIPSVQLSGLTSEGFNVIPNRRIDALSDSYLSKRLKTSKNVSDYAIDGLVVIQDAKNKLTKGNPTWGKAFKETTEDDIVQTEVVAVHWGLSKDGLAKPRLEIQPVQLAGVTVTFATAHNAFYVCHGFLKDEVRKQAVFGNTLKPMPIGPGSIISITRSGDVIPFIVSVDTPAKKPQMPEDFEWEWNATGVDILASNPDDFEIIAIKRVANFFRTIGTVGVDQGIVAKCFEKGFNTVDLILEMEVADWLLLNGVKITTATKCYNAIKVSLHDVYLPTLGDATGLFGRGFGTKKLEKVLEAFPDLEELNKLTFEKLKDKIIGVHGFQVITASQFAAGLPLFLEWLDGKDITFADLEEVEVVGDQFEGQTVCFTNFRNADWAALIESQGGLMSDFNSNVTLLVYPDGKPSKKVDTAKAKGIRAITVSEFAASL